MDAYSTDGLDTIFLSKIEDTVKDKHVANTIKRCFIEHKITYRYFQNHKRKDLVALLRKYKIKISISIKLWAAFTNNNNDDYDQWNVQQICLDSPQELGTNKDCISEPEAAHINNQCNNSVKLANNKYTKQFAYFTSSNTESKTTKEDKPSTKHMLYALLRGYSRQYFHDNYEDIVKLLIFYYASIVMLPLIKLSLDKIKWNNLELIKSESTKNDTTKSVVIAQKAMNDFCLMALERLNNNYDDNLIQISETEWVLIVHIIDDDGNCDIGVSFKYNDKSEDIFVATAIYIDKIMLEVKHKLIRWKHNYCKNLRPFSLRAIKFVNDEIIEMKQDYNDNDEDRDITSEMECQSDWESA